MIYMMLIVTNQDLYRYEIHSLVKAFYPQEDVRVVVDGSEKARKLGGGAETFLHVLMEESGITLIIRKDGAETVTRAAAANGESFARKNPACKTALKHLLYNTLKEFTGQKLPWGDLIGIRPTKIPMTMMEGGSTPEEARRFLETEHYVSAEKAVLAVDIAQRESGILSKLHYQNGYSLYIGIPFCPTTCLYCSFPSFNVALWKERVDDYLTALEKEMEACSDLFAGKILDTVYIGGGTPTTLSPAQLERLTAAIRRNFDTGSLLEFTVEAGRPDSITKDKLQVLKENGISRISVNPQTMKDETLRIIGRHHSVQQVIDTYFMARGLGFDNINMDIILGLPAENAEDVRHTVAEIEKLSPDSLTVHSLAVKRASRLRRIIDENGYPTLVNTDETMRIAAQGAARMGMEPYYLYRQKNMSGNFENTGYAKPDKYGIYNILIMEEKQSILALGAGSISKIVVPGQGGSRIERSDNPKDVASYIANTDEMIRRKRELYRGLLGSV